MDQPLALDQFAGFLFFLTMAMVGFWCLTYLIAMVPYWITFGAAEFYGKINKDVDPEDVRRKRLYEQEGIETLYRK